MPPSSLLRKFGLSPCEGWVPAAGPLHARRPPFFSGTGASLRSSPAKPRGLAALPQVCCENPHYVEVPDGSQEGKPELLDRLGQLHYTDVDPSPPLEGHAFAWRGSGSIPAGGTPHSRRAGCHPPVRPILNEEFLTLPSVSAHARSLSATWAQVGSIQRQGRALPPPSPWVP